MNSNFIAGLLSFALISWLLIAVLLFASYLATPFLKKSKGKKPQSTPLISVIIPAKDEEENIEACIRSILAQDYTNLEILVVDDRSNDRTLEIASKFENSESKVRVIQVKELPKGWTGKNHAIHEGVKPAGGELLLFVDADTEHDPRTITSSVVQMEQHSLDALSIEPYFVWTRFIQKLTFSILTTVVACLFPIFLVNHKGSHRTLSNGQYILIKKKVYDTIGGHEAIKNRILEDLALIENTKKNGFNYNLAVGTDFIKVKMYRDLATFWKGWGRILFPALKRNLLLATFLYFLAIVISIIPFIIVFHAFLAWMAGLPPLNTISILAICVICTIYITNGFINYFFRINPFYTLLHPFAVLSGMAILGNSVWISLKKKQIEWKGTIYNIASNP